MAKLLGVLEVLLPDLSGLSDHRMQENPPDRHQVGPIHAKGGKRRLEMAQVVVGIKYDWPSSQAKLQRHGFWTWHLQPGRISELSARYEEF